MDALPPPTALLALPPPVPSDDGRLLRRRTAVFIAGWLVLVLALLPWMKHTAGGVFWAGAFAATYRWVLPHTRLLLSAAAQGWEPLKAYWRALVTDASRALAPPPLIQLLWHAASIVLMLGIAVVSMVPPGNATELIFRTALWFLVAVETLDLLVLGIAFLRWSLGRRLGVVLVGIAATVVAAVALSLARRTVFGLTGEDPGSFPASVLLLTGILAPVAWLLFTAVVSAILLLPVMLSSLALAAEVRNFSQPSGAFHGFIQASRPSILCLIPIILAVAAFQTDAMHNSSLRYAARMAVLGLDYWERPVCGGPSTVAVRLDDRRYSVLMPGQNTIRFRTITCPELKAAAPVDHF